MTGGRAARAATRIFARRVACLASLALMLLLALSACGKKGPVRPLLGSLPAAPQQPLIHQRGENFIVAWDIPTKNQDGTEADDIGAFHIYRSEYAIIDGCATCREPTERVAKVDLKYPITQRISQRIYWQDPEVRAGRGYRYRIVPVIIGGREGADVTVQRDWMTPPPPPQQLRAQADQGRVILDWRPPAEMPDGAVLLGYNLYRRSGDRPFPIVPLNAHPLENRQIVDRALEPGRVYQYRLSTLVQLGQRELESAPSETVQISLQTSE